jgi:hypothetical protein
MKKGIESLKAAVQHDTEQYENCFNENGCDHEFTRIVPETNPKLIAMGFSESCISVSKCSHKYCDKYKWVIERAKHYAEKTGKTYEEVIEIWESNRTYWYMNYYQDSNQPLNGRKKTAEQVIKTSERIEFLKKEIDTYDFLSTTLTQEHQQSVKNDILMKVENMKRELSDCQSRIKLYEISCFAS